jgi:hypothetical protein
MRRASGWPRLADSGWLRSEIAHRHIVSDVGDLTVVERPPLGHGFAGEQAYRDVIVNVVDFILAYAHPPRRPRLLLHLFRS